MLRPAILNLVLWFDLLDSSLCYSSPTAAQQPRGLHVDFVNCCCWSSLQQPRKSSRDAAKHFVLASRFGFSLVGGDSSTPLTTAELQPTAIRFFWNPFWYLVSCWRELQQQQRELQQQQFSFLPLLPFPPLPSFPPLSGLPVCPVFVSIPHFPKSILLFRIADF